MAIKSNIAIFPLGQTIYITAEIGKCWTQTGGVWTNETTDINSSTSADVPLGGAVNDAIYFGSTTIYGALYYSASTSPAGGAVVAEYWDGSAWSTLTTSGGNFVNSGTQYWAPPSNWATTQVNSEVDGPWYYVRQRVTTTRTTAGALTIVNYQPLVQIANAVTLELPEASSNVISAVLKVHHDFGSPSPCYTIYGESRTGSNAYASAVNRFYNSAGILHAEGAGVNTFWDQTATISAILDSGGSGTYDFRYGALVRSNAAPGNSGFFTNYTAELIVTYEFDDSETTQLNTLQLPLDSITGRLTTSLASFATIPQLTSGGLIPESSPTIKSIFLKLICNTNGNGTNDYELKGSLDGAGEITLAQYDAAANSKFYSEIFWDLTSISTTTTHTIDLRTTSTTGGFFTNIGAILIVTYEYDDSATTNYARTIVLPKEITPTLNPPNSSSAVERAIYNVNFTLPMSATLIQSGAIFYTNYDQDPGSINLWFGSQSSTSYAVDGAGITGVCPIVRRFDSGSTYGSGLTLAQGDNSLVVNFESSGSSIFIGALQALVFLNITYAKASTKISRAFALMVGGDFGTVNTRNTATFSLPITETEYWIIGSGFVGLEYNDSSSALGAARLFLGNNLGYLYAGGGLMSLVNNNGTRFNLYDFDNIFKQYPTDPTNTVDIETSHTMTHDFPFGCGWLGGWFNWHNYTYTVSGTISGSSGGTVNLKLFRTSDYSLFAQTTRSGNGSYSFTVYDPTEDFIVVAVESDTLKGASKSDVATTGFDINLAGGSGGGSSFSFGYVG